MWTTRIKGGLEPLSGQRMIEKGLGENFQWDRRARGDYTRDVVNSIGDAGSSGLVCWHHRWNCVMNRDRMALCELARNVHPVHSTQGIA